MCTPLGQGFCLSCFCRVLQQCPVHSRPSVNICCQHGLMAGAGAGGLWFCGPGFVCSLQRSLLSPLSRSAPACCCHPTPPHPPTRASTVFSALLLSDPQIGSKKIFQRLDTPSTFPALLPEAGDWWLTDVFFWRLLGFRFLSEITSLPAY